METHALKQPTGFEDAATETAPGIRHGRLSPCHDAEDRPPVVLPAPEASMRLMWSNIGRWVIAIAAATTSIGYFDPRNELRRSCASSIVWTARRKSGRPISLREARQIALQVLAETERRLAEERAAEARFLLVLWEDEAPS